jgi:NitT/TauT family transport system permease protein
MNVSSSSLVTPELIARPPRRVKSHFRATLVYMAPLIALLMLWELISVTGLVDSRMLPAPHAIVVRGIELLSGDNNYILLDHAGHSIFRALIAFVLAALVAVPVGFALGLSRTAYAWISPCLSMLLPLPAVAWTPIFLVTLGKGDTTIICVCFLGATVRSRACNQSPGTPPGWCAQWEPAP